MQGLQLVGVPRFELGTSSPPDRASGGDARRRPTPIAVTKRVCRASRVSRPAWLRERVRGRLGQDWATVLVGASEPVHPSTEPRGGTMESENGHMTKVERDELAKLVRRPREAREGPTPTASPPTGSLTSRSSSPASTSQPTTRSGGTHEEAAKIVANAAKQIAERCRALSIPENFRPELMVSWYGRGENASACVVASCALSPRPASTGTPRPPRSRSSVAPSIYRRARRRRPGVGGGACLPRLDADRRGPDGGGSLRRRDRGRSRGPPGTRAELILQLRARAEPGDRCGRFARARLAGACSVTGRPGAASVVGSGSGRGCRERRSRD